MSGLVADVSGAGPAVVLLHGQPGSRGDWPQVTRLLEADFRVVVPDRPGYGDTGGRARGFRANAAAVLSLLDQLGVERATVVGYSWAGGVALALAQAARARLAGLVLVSSVCPGEPLGRLDKMLAVPPIGTALTAGGLFLARGAVAFPPVRRSLQRRQRADATGNDGDGDVAAPDTPDTADARDARDASDASHVQGPTPDEVITSWRSNRVWQSFVTEQRCLVDELPLLVPGLAAISVPTVVLVGDADRMVPPANGRRLARAIPGARLVEVHGAGHLLAHQHPDAVAAAVRDVTHR